MISGQFKHYLDHILRDYEKKCKTKEILSVKFIFSANWKKTVTYTILVMEHLSPVMNTSVLKTTVGEMFI